MNPEFRPNQSPRPQAKKEVYSAARRPEDMSDKELAMQPEAIKVAGNYMAYNAGAFKERLEAIRAEIERRRNKNKETLH